MPKKNMMGMAAVTLKMLENTSSTHGFEGKHEFSGGNENFREKTINFVRKRDFLRKDGPEEKKKAKHTEGGIG